MTMRNALFFVAVGLSVCLVASVASADVTSLLPSVVDNSAGGDDLLGFVTNDVKIDFAGQYTGAQAWIQLDTGSVYQHPAGSALPPNQLVVDSLPALGFDTFVAQGSDRAGGTNGEPSPGGGAVDLGAPASADFGAAGINQAWNPAGGVVIEDMNDFLLGRFTLSDDAVGSAQFLASAANVRSTYEFSIMNGVIGGTTGVEPTIMEIVLDDRELSDGPISMQLNDGGADPAANWSGLSLEEGSPAIAASLSDAGLFEWDPAGSVAGRKGNGVLYRWSATAANDSGTDSDFAISVRLIPEPATLSLFGLAMIACVGVLRRRG